MLLIATYRDDELATSYPLRVALGELATRGHTRRIELAPLSANAVRELARGTGRDAERLHLITGGNPFYVLEILQVPDGAVPEASQPA